MSFPARRWRIFVLAGVLLLTLPVGAATKARGGLSLGLSLGFTPDLFALSTKEENLGEQNIRMLNRINRINELYQNTSGIPVVRDFRYGNTSVSSFPAEISLKYSFYGLLVRLGYVYHNPVTNSKSYTANTGPGTIRAYPNEESNLTLQEDFSDLYDQDPSNDEELARGLRPTYGQNVRFTQHMVARQWEIPFTIAISMFDLGPASFYFGGGMTLFFGEKTRIIKAEILDDNLENEKYFQDDVDRFSARKLGFNIMTGGEYRFSPRVGVMMELAFNFGRSGAVRDAVRTGSYTNNTLFHANNILDKGGNENPDQIEKEVNSGGIQMGEGVERTSALEFTGYRITLGLNFHLFLDKPTPKEGGIFVR